jgi:hypothetical protein
MKSLIVLACFLVLIACAEEPASLLSFQVEGDSEPTAEVSMLWVGVKGVTIERSILGESFTNLHAEVRSRWTTNNLYLLFTVHYDALNLRTNADTTTETFRLWFYDCVEAYIGADPEHPNRYRELQMSPQGEFLDLDIDSTKPRPGFNGEQAWNSGMKVKARVDERQKIWYGEMSVPFSAIDSRPPQAGNELRVNFCRQDGKQRRTFMAWQPTGEWTPHRPEKFGTLRLVGKGGTESESVGGGVSVTFLAFTERPFDTLLERSARFVITNHLNYAISYSSDPPYGTQLKSNGVWYPHPELSHTYGLTWDELGLTHGALEPGAWTNVAVAVPYEATIWRASVRTWQLPIRRIGPPYDPGRTNYGREIVNESNRPPQPSN